MASLTIRNLDDAVKIKLRVLAAQHGRSMEDEVRTILRAAVDPEQAADARNLVQRIRSRFSPLGDVALPQPERKSMRAPPTFSD